MSERWCRYWAVGLLMGMVLLVVAACNPAGSPSTTSVDEIPALEPILLEAGARLQVVATTSMVYDVVSQVGGDAIALDLLLPLGTDPHAFEPTPQDVALVADADLVFVNGAGLETFLEPLLGSAGADQKAVPVSAGITLLHADEEHEGEQEHQEEEHDHEGGDPHTWTDPRNVMVWVDNIEQVLQAVDPANSELYAANAQAYQTELEELDGWVRTQVAGIPEADRQIVTDHQAFSYFAEEYGFVQVGAIIPSYNTMAEPTARELADLEDAIRTLGVKAVFVGNTVNPTLAGSVAEDTGVRLVQLLTGSLTPAGGPAPTYVEYIEYNVTTIVEALQ